MKNQSLYRVIVLCSIFVLTASFVPNIGWAQQGKVLSFSSTQDISKTWTISTFPLTIVSGQQEKVLNFSAATSAESTSKNGSSYYGVMVPLGKTWDFTNVRLALDARSDQPKNTSIFFVRAYNKNETTPALSFFSANNPLSDKWQTVYLQKGDVGSSLSSEANKGKGQTPNRIDRIEFIIGSTQANAKLNVQLANMRSIQPMIDLAHLKTPKKLMRSISLVKPNQNAIVLYPDSPEGKKAAGNIVNAIKQKTGVTLQMRPGAKADRQFDQNVIMLGDVFNNPAMLLLYSREFTPVDAICPGAGGYLVQTIPDPFGNGHGAVVVGASDNDGLQKAASVFSNRIRNSTFTGKVLSMPRFFDAKYSKELISHRPWVNDKNGPNIIKEGLKEGQEILDRGTHGSISTQLKHVAWRYQLTQNSNYAKLFVQLWDLYAKSAVYDPSKMGGGMWGFDSDFSSWGVLCGWDNIEEDPAITDAQRLQVTQDIVRWLRQAVAPKASMTPGHVAFNHQTFPALGLLRAGLYFTESYPDVAEGKQWLAKADRVFQNQEQFFKSKEDCNTYQWITQIHVMHYALARPDFTLFNNGNARRISNYAIGTMNNLEYQVPYGDTGNWRGSAGEQVPLNITAFATGDKAALWASSLKQSLTHRYFLNDYQRSAKLPAPKGFSGVKMWPLEPAYVVTFPDDSRPSDNQLFDKISFRQSFDKNTPYLLLDGLNNGGHGHRDGNSLEQLTQYDRIWLADNDYFKSQVKYHNSMQILHNGEGDEIPPYVALLGHGDANDYGYSHTQLSNYVHSNWDRYVVWLKKEQAFVVLDKVTAEQSGEFQYRLLWHGMGAPKLTDQGMLLTQKGPSMWIQVAKGPALKLVNDAALGKDNWSGYEYADPIVRSMSATARVKLQKGQHYLFATIFHGQPKQDAKPWKVDLLKGYEGAEIHTGNQSFVIQTNDGKVSIQASPQKTTFVDSGTLTTSKSTFTAKAYPPKVAAAPPIVNLTENYTAPAFKIDWSISRTALNEKATSVPFSYTQLAMAQLQKGAPKVLIASTKEGTLMAISQQGKLLWSKKFPTQLNGVAAGDVNNDGIDEIAIARQDGKVMLLDSKGDELWNHQLSFYREPPYVNLVMMGDLNGNGKDEVVVGSQNWRFYTFDGSGKELWQYETVHASVSGALGDLDGDGTKEVLAGTHYYTAWALSHDGKMLWALPLSPPICYDITTGAFSANSKTRGVVLGGGNGNIYVTTDAGKVRLQFNTGDEVKHVATADLDGDGIDEILATSDNGYLYCFGADTKLRWMHHLQNIASALATLKTDKGTLAVVGTEGGNVMAFDAQGKLIGKSILPAAVTRFVNNSNSLFVASADGRLRELALE